MKNEIESILAAGQSKKMAVTVVNLILKDESRIEELMQCFFSDELRTCQHAAWPVGILAEKQPSLLLPYLARMVSNLDEPKHDAVVRNTLRTFQFMKIPEELQSEVYDRCLEYLSNPKYPIAFTAFGMTVCADIAMQYPELREEVISAIDYRMPHGSAGVRSRGAREKRRLLSAKSNSSF